MEYDTSNGEIFHKIYINKENEDGEEVSLRKYYSLGLKRNRKYNTLSFPIDINENDEFLNVFKGIVKKRKDHLMNISIKGKVKELKGLKLTSLNNFGSCLSNKDGRPPVLHVRVPTEYGTQTVIPEFYEKEDIDDPDKLSKLIENPYVFMDKECIVNAAVTVEDIFIKGNIISLQVKLYEVEISVIDKRPKRNVPRRRLLLSGR